VPSAPLRVMYLTPYYRPYLGGIERAIEELSHQIQASPEVEAVGVLTTKYSFPRVAQPDWPDRETLPDGVEVFRLPGFPRWSPPLYSVPLVWFSPRRVRQYLDEFRPNVIHFVGDGWFWGHFWSWFFYRKRARFIFTPSYHTLPVVRWWLRPINAFICNAVDRVVALTRQESREVGRAYLTPSRKISVIGWGAPVPDEAMVQMVHQERQESGDGPLTILCVGRLGRHKAQLWLLEVYRQARTGFRKPVRLVLVGRDEGDAQAIAGFVERNGLSDEVEVTGEVTDEELAGRYARADFFVLFSHYEAFGLVFFEAMTYGAPVLTHDVGANRELLHRGAVVIPRFDEQAAVSAITRLVNDDAERQRLGADARDYALSEFTWPAVAEKYLEAYRGG
jgi:glycosyltransferase involved in cell wall biosynthesis